MAETGGPWVHSGFMSRFLRFFPRYFTAALCSQYLFTFGWLKSRNRALIHSINAHFGFGPSTIAPTLPVVKPGELLALNGPLELHEPVAADGNVSLLELTILARSVALAQPRCLFEIGTFDGRTTLNLAANAPADARVLTLDLPAQAATGLAVADGDRRYIDKPASGARFAGHALAARITQLYGDSATFDFAPYAGQVDWMFIDGAHSAEYVRKDSQTAKALVKTGGWVFWHDYGVWDGVTEALNALASEPWFTGIRHIEGTSLAVLQK